MPGPGSAISDATLAVTDGGASYIFIPSGQTATLTFPSIGRVCRIINGPTTQAGHITFTDSNNVQFFDAFQMAGNAVVNLQFPPFGGSFTVAFSAGSSGQLIFTYN